MILGGLALAFSRVIDNSVISLENIYRHLESGEDADEGRAIRRFGGDAGRAGRDVWSTWSISFPSLFFTA